MPLDIPLDTAPMEAATAAALPEGEGWQYEPKWDGFRCLAHRDGARVDLVSKSGQPLGRYFPDLVAALGRVHARHFVLDGEIVIPIGDTTSFEALQMRLHPAESRVRSLAAAHPARYMVFDVLADGGGRDVTGAPLDARRAVLERLGPELDEPAIALSPLARDLAEAQGWLDRPVEGRDGVMAKRRDAAYRPGKRDAMVKVKRVRTADCVVGGFRYLAKAHQVGSLLLGLYDADGLLNHVGYTSTIAGAERGALTTRLSALTGEGFTGRSPGGPSRWSTATSARWQPLRPELVVEVRFDQVTAGRFRHGTTLLRYRPDKAPRQCTIDQIGRLA